MSVRTSRAAAPPAALRRAAAPAARLALVALLVAPVATACGRRDADADASPPAVAAADSMPGMPGMGGMGGMGGMAMASGHMMDDMRARLRALDGASADRLRAALPEHRRALADMIAAMNREMRDMRMPADAAWDATVDSLRTDLTGMPELAPGELAAIMPAHRARVDRLMASHREMMARMMGPAVPDAPPGRAP